MTKDIENAKNREYSVHCCSFNLQGRFLNIALMTNGKMFDLNRKTSKTWQINSKAKFFKNKILIGCDFFFGLLNID